jgi:hypothetical protein
VIYVFDTSALVSLAEKSGQAQTWMQQVQMGALCYFHPISLAEIATQSHPEYLMYTQKRSFERAQVESLRRRELLKALAFTKANPGPAGERLAERPPWLARREFRRFDTSTKALQHQRGTVYEQLIYEKRQRSHLYRAREGRVVVLADMVDHMILSVATFLWHEKGGGVTFVTRDLQLLEAAERVHVPTVYASVYPPRATGGAWLDFG